MEKFLTNLLQICSLKSQNVFVGSVLHFSFVIKKNEFTGLPKRNEKGFGQISSSLYLTS